MAEIEHRAEKEEKLRQILKTAIESMRLRASIDIRQEEERLFVNVEGEELGLLIGRQGQTLDALQYLLNIIINKGGNSPSRVVLDVQGYKESKRRNLESLAKRVAEEVASTKEAVYLRAMNPFERRIIHLALNDHSGVRTVSEGEEPNRRVKIIPK